MVSCCEEDDDGGRSICGLCNCLVLPTLYCLSAVATSDVVLELGLEVALCCSSLRALDLDPDRSSPDVERVPPRPESDSTLIRSAEDARECGSGGGSLLLGACWW